MAEWASSDGKDVLGDFYAEKISLPLDFIVDPSETKMFGSMGESAYLFEAYNMTLNAHSHGLDLAKFDTDEGLKKYFFPTSTSEEPDGEHLTFVASMESANYPLFATQFHPEKTFTMFKENEGVNHSWMSEMMNRKFGDYFMSLARQNTNTYGDYAAVQPEIIANFDMIVTDGYYGEVYMFNSTDIFYS